MTDSTDSGDDRKQKTEGKTLSLKRTVDSGQVRQSFSRGRTKSVVVEKKRKRILKPGEGAAEATPAPAATPKPAATPAPAPVAKAPTPEAAPKAASAAPVAATPAAPTPAVASAPDAAKPAAAPTAPVAKAAEPAKAAPVAAAPTPAATPASATTPAPAKPAAKTAPAAPAPKAAAPKAATSKAAPAAKKPEAKRTPPAAKKTPARAGGRPNQRGGSVRGDGRPAAGRTLTAGEQAARERALKGARIRAVEEKKKAEEEAKKRAIEEIRLAKERAEREAIEAQEMEKRRLEEAARPKPKPEPAKPAARPASRTAKPAARGVSPADAPGETMVEKTKSTKQLVNKKPASAMRRDTPPQTPARKTTEQRRRGGKLTISRALNDRGDRQRSLAAMRRRVEREKKKARGQHHEPREKVSREVIIPDIITVQDLANRMAERAVDVIKTLMKQGMMVKLGDVLETDIAQLVAEEFGHTVKRVSEADVEEGLTTEDDDDDAKEGRAPVVTVMGHVDHGKTSLLDALRSTDVAAGEAGGITQHIGAYQVNMASGAKITFLDTPGHAAFTAMRARGAKVTDIVILVVAADDGVMPQTIEAINHAKAAGVPLIVAINKMDKPDANSSRVTTDLLQHEVVLESMGGDVQAIEVSAKTRMGLDTLEEAILLQAELLELKANPDRDAEGAVVEAKLDRGRGNVATALVQRGTLTVGNVVVAGAVWGRVRALINDRGENIVSAGPSEPVEILGLNGTPEAGDHFVVVENEGRAREVTEYRQRVKRDKRTASTRTSLDQLLQAKKSGEQHQVPIIVKSDVQGSAEAIVQALEKLGNAEVTARVIHSGVGGVTESDITLAETSGAPVIGFNVRANVQAREIARAAGIEIRYYSVIYDLVDDVKAAMSGMLSPEMRETFLGNAEILEVFNISKVGKVAGCRVTEGQMRRGSTVRLIRDDVVVHEGKLSTLKRFKDEVKEVPTGQECGMAFENYQDMRAGDVIECFDIEEITRTLD